MAIKFIMVSYVFLKHKNHPIVGVFYPKLRPKQEYNFYPRPDINKICA